jgi:pimeloyl-ACP methyl ester carboxylesterase
MLLPAAASAGAIHPECVRSADHAKSIHFRSHDSARLAGVVLGHGPRGVVLAHQSRGDLCSWLPFARTLAHAGYRVLPFDFAGYGASSSSPREDLAADVAAAGRALRDDGAKRVVYLGASAGGTASLAAAGGSPAPAGVISLSGPALYNKLDAGAVVREVDVPLLLIAARGDRAFAGDQTTLYKAARTKDKQVVLVAGYDHGVDLLAGPARARVNNLILAFLRRHLA